jgi:hypothetical protein
MENYLSVCNNKHFGGGSWCGSCATVSIHNYDLIVDLFSKLVFHITFLLLWLKIFYVDINYKRTRINKELHN